MLNPVDITRLKVVMKERGFPVSEGPTFNANDDQLYTDFAQRFLGLAPNVISHSLFSAPPALAELLLAVEPADDVKASEIDVADVADEDTADTPEGNGTESTEPPVTTSPTEAELAEQAEGSESTGTEEGTAASDVGTEEDGADESAA